MKPLLTTNDYQKAAQRLGCEVAAIKAVAEVESSGNGFYANGTVKSKYEAHIFKRLTGKTASSYQQAYGINAKAAMEATSWGKFQIMGFNATKIGYSSASSMVAAFEKNEQNQLQGFVQFIEWKKLQNALKNRDWQSFAYSYNGADYAKYGYHTKMAQAYQKYSQRPVELPTPEAAPQKRSVETSVIVGVVIAGIGVALAIYGRKLNAKLFPKLSSA
jgi:hypothetical protein